MIAQRLFRRALDDCDVRDCLALALYREKRQEWAALLEQDDRHSAFQQLTGLLWDDAKFHLFNAMRRMNAPAMRAPLVAETIDEWYVTSMVLGISRLTDDHRPDWPERGVVSLRRVFNDMREHRNLFTREIYVCNEGLRYDVDAIPSPWERGIEPGVVHWEEIGGPFDVSTPRRLHAAFDKLCGVPSHRRSRRDVLRKEIFKEIDGLLNAPAVVKFRALRNKIVAHAADSTSRAKVALAGFTISMSDAEQALRALLKAHDRMQADILWASGGSQMPIAQFDVLEGLRCGLSEGEKAALEEKWEQLVQARSKWHE